MIVPTGYEPPDRPGGAPSAADVPWIEPYPDRLLRVGSAAAAATAAPDPAEEASRRVTTSLAFLTAVQLLTARQRAVLILREVLAFSTAEVADLLDTSPATSPP